MWKLIQYRLRTPEPTRSLQEMSLDKNENATVSPPDRESRKLRRQWRARLNGVFGGSLHVRHVDTGSCNACEWELTTLLGPVYDVQRLGIDFVASPRHADVLIVTGALTRHLLEALQMTCEATPDPKAVVALGDCACGTGLIGRTYAQAGAIESFVPVLVTIPGCPPHPHEILRGLLEAMTKLEERRTGREHGTTAI